MAPPDEKKDFPSSKAPASSAKPAQSAKPARGSKGSRGSAAAAVTVPVKDSDAGVHTVPSPPSWDSMRGELVTHDDDEDGETMALDSAARAVARATMDGIYEMADVDDTEVQTRAALEELAGGYGSDTDIHDATLARMEMLAAAGRDDDPDVHDDPVHDDPEVRVVPLDGSTAVRDELDGITAVREEDTQRKSRPPGLAAAPRVDHNKATMSDLRRALEVGGGGEPAAAKAPARPRDAPKPRAGVKVMLPVPRLPAGAPYKIDAEGPPPLAIRLPLGSPLPLPVTVTGPLVPALSVLPGLPVVPAAPSSRGVDDEFWIRDTAERPRVVIRETAALPLVRLADDEIPPSWPPRHEHVPRPPWAGAKAEAEASALRDDLRTQRGRARTAWGVAAMALLGAGVMALLYVQESRKVAALEKAGASASLLGPADPNQGPPVPARQGFSARSSEEGVKVIVDDRERGILPMVIDDLSPGAHRVRFQRANGRGSSERTVVVEPGVITDLGSIELP